MGHRVTSPFIVNAQRKVAVGLFGFYFFIFLFQRVKSFNSQEISFPWEFNSLTSKFWKPGKPGSNSDLKFEIRVCVVILMATRNRTVVYRRHRDAVKSVRAPLFSSASGSGGPVIEMASLLGSNRSSYAPLSTEDPGPSRYAFFVVNFYFILFYNFLYFLFVWWESGGKE